VEKRRITGLYMLRRLWRLRGSGRLDHYVGSLRSHASLHPYFANPGNPWFPLSGLQKCNVQSERYAQYNEEFCEYFKNILTKVIIKVLN
jgi:hypothetical protein